MSAPPPVNSSQTARQNAAKQGAAALAAQQAQQAAQRAQAAANDRAIQNGRISSGFGNGRITFDSKGNVLVDGKLATTSTGQPLFSSQNAQDRYLAERGIANTGELINADLAAKGDFSEAPSFQPINNTAFQNARLYRQKDNGDNSSELIFSNGKIIQSPGGVQIFFGSNKPTKAPETTNISFTPKGEGSSISSDSVFSAKQPTSKNNNSEAEKAFGAGRNSSGVKNSFLIDKSYGQRDLGQNIRNTQAEADKKASEAQRATQVFGYSTYDNADYATGGTPPPRSQGGIATPQSVFLESKTNYGQRGRENIRNTQAEADKQTSEAIRALSKTNNDENQVYNLWGVKANKPTNGGVPISQNSFANKSPSGQGISYEINFSENLGVGESLFIGGKGTPKSGSTNQLSEKDFTAMLSREEQQGAVFDIIDANTGKVIKTTSGQRTYYDFLNVQQQNPNAVIVTRYPQAEAEIISQVRKNPSQYEKQPESYWQNLGKEGFLTQKGMSTINGMFYRDYLNSPAYKQAVAQDQAFRDYLTTQGAIGKFTTFSILDKNGNVIETTQSPRAYHDFLEAQHKYGDDISIRPNYAFSTSEYFQAITSPTKAKGDVTPSSFFSSLEKSAVEAGYSIYGIGTSIFDFGSKIPVGGGRQTFKGSNLNETSNNQNLIKDIEAITVGQIPFIGGLRLGQLAKGKAEFRDVPLSPSGQKIIKEGGNSSDFINSQLGLQNGTASDVYASAFFQGAALGATVVGLKGLSPIKAISTGYKLTLENGKVEPTYSGLFFGYDRFGTPKPFIGFVAGKFKIGKPTQEEYQPIGSKEIIENLGRGYEPSTPSKAELGIITSKPFVTRKFELNPSNREIENPGLESGLMGRAKIISDVLAKNKNITNKRYSDVLETSGREGIDKQVIQGGLVGISKKQGNLSALNPITGKAGKIQGSTGLPQFLMPDLASQVKPHDIDVIKSNPLGLFEETQAKNLAKSTNKEIQKTQGILPEKGVSFHATDDASARNIISNGVDLTASKRGNGFFTMNDAGTLGRFGNVILKVKYKTRDILKYSSISKQDRKNIASRNWLKFQNNLIDFGKSKGYNGVTKPYYNTRKGAGLRTDSKLNEIIFTNPEAITSIEKLSDVQPTFVEGRRIYTDQEKAIEFVTRKDETGSSKSRSGTVYGIKIDSKTFKPVIEGTNRQAKTTSGVFQLQTNIAKQAFQNKESATEQSATPEQLSIIGNGEYFGPELFAGKAIKRPYLQTINFVREAVKSGNPKLKQDAFKALEAAHYTRYYQADNPKTALYDWDKLELTKEGEGSSLVQTPSSLASGSKALSKSSLSLISGNISFKPSTQSGASNKSSRSSQSAKGIYSLFSKSSLNNSLISGQSGSSKSSIFSGKSNISIQSSKSGNSVSSKSGNSGKSGSSSSSLSIFSTPSGFSGSDFSGNPNSGPPSGSSGFGGFSTGNPNSGPPSGSSGFGGFSTGNPPPYQPPPVKGTIIPPSFGNWFKKRKYKTRQKPTGIFKLDVTNIFAPSFSIYEKGSRIEL